jgi:hypothetical protein
MNSGAKTTRLPAPRSEVDPQVLLIRSLATDVTDRKLTHDQAVAELRRQLTDELAPRAPRAVAGA